MTLYEDLINQGKIEDLFFENNPYREFRSNYNLEYLMQKLKIGNSDIYQVRNIPLETNCDSDSSGNSQNNSDNNGNSSDSESEKTPILESSSESENESDYDDQTINVSDHSQHLDENEASHSDQYDEYYSSSD